MDPSYNQFGQFNSGGQPGGFEQSNPVGGPVQLNNVEGAVQPSPLNDPAQTNMSSDFVQPNPMVGVQPNPMMGAQPNFQSDAVFSNQMPVEPMVNPMQPEINATSPVQNMPAQSTMPMSSMPVQPLFDGGVNANTGDIVLASGDGTAAVDKKKWGIIGAVVGVLMLIGVSLGVMVGMSGGNGGGEVALVSNDAELDEVLFYGTDEEWQRFYDSESKIIESNSSKKSNVGEILKEQFGLLRMFDTYRIINKTYDLEDFVNKYLNGEASIETVNAVLNSEMNSLSSSFTQDYYDYVEEKYSLAIEIAQIYGRSSCYNNDSGIVMECQLSQEDYQKVESILTDIWLIDDGINNTIQRAIDYYDELTHKRSFK